MVAVDGKEMNFTLEQVEEGQMLLGYAENGNPLSHSQGGPYRLFATTDKYKWAQYWLKFVCEIRVL
jgi:DMSO/TMAO reductase YedYZ molybdopterin-dependent catalytic subunit